MRYGVEKSYRRNLIHPTDLFTGGLMKISTKAISSCAIILAALSAVTCVQMNSKRVTAQSNSQRAISGDIQLSGYKIGFEMCGMDALQFPRLQIGTRPGTCVGLVASREDGLKNVRNILQLPRTPYFLVVDQNIAAEGKIFKLDPTAPPQSRLTVLLDHLDAPMGIAIGPNDGLVYVGLTEEIIRFDARADAPAKTVETVVRGFPARNLAFPNTPVMKMSNHPQKQIVFDPAGNLYVNVGAPTDNCTAGVATVACDQSRGTPTIATMAAIWKFAVAPGKSLPALKPGEKNAQVGSRQFEVYATGLRNSMAMAIHPSFPAGAFIQAENARDLPGQGRPNEEINLIEKGKNYGWPYCYDLDKTNSEYLQFTKSGTFKNFCKNSASYQAPFSLMPPHVAALGATFYTANRFPELQNSLLLNWHGYISTGSRLVFYKTDATGLPLIQNKPIQYRKNCDGNGTHTLTSDGDAINSGAQYEEIISDWYRVAGIRPQGAPVGITVAEDGAIWIVEDKNATVLRIDVDPTNTITEKLACDGRSEDEIKELYAMIQTNSENKNRLTRVRKALGDKHCSQCHGGFDLKPEMTSEMRDETFAHSLLSQSGWIYPNDPEASQIHERTRRVGLGASKPMPPNWADIMGDPEYTKALDDLDQLILTMVPGKRRYILPQRAPVALVRGADQIECGRIPTASVVTVTDMKPSNYPGMVKIFRPESRFLSKPCKDGYFVPDWAVTENKPAGP